VPRRWLELLSYVGWWSSLWPSAIQGCPTGLNFPLWTGISKCFLCISKW
jgi:hypothetical protein